ncbi:hypothetical protein CL689_06695 [Candidatus Saccharibacteria bacterium]|nr:hypothetical protein [Candidatus Saccharibacteria bacterium]|tara:strand:- start:487 stop:993 length:507 start_codon:yes stop_codon:yes gene_type:complete
MRIRLYSAILNWWRLLFASSRHRRNVHRSKGLIGKLQWIRTNSGEGAVIAYLRKTDPYVFEELILTAFERRGLLVRRGTHYSGDGGIDGMVRFKGEWYLIQAKRYKSHINGQHVRDFDDRLEREDKKGFFIHTGKTGDGARSGVTRGRSKIISGGRMVDLLLSDERFA